MNPSDETSRYPTPRPPMQGRYLVRKAWLATALSAIDTAARLAPSRRGSVPTDGRGLAPRSILVSQGGHIGDLIMTLPMLQWIRTHQPEVRIGLVIGSWSKLILPSIKPLFDASYIVDHMLINRSGDSRGAKFRQHRETWATAKAAIKADGYDVAIDTFPFILNNIPFLYSCGIPERVGFTCGGLSPLLTRPVEWRHGPRAYADYQRDLLKAIFTDASLDEPLTGFYPAVPEPSPVDPGEGYVLAQIGAGAPHKEWPDADWESVLTRLSKDGYRVVLAGAGKREKTRAEALAAKVPGAIDLCDTLKWPAFVALVAGASHVICLDSSSSHVAAGFKIPSTVIMPSINDHRQFGPASPNSTVMSFKTPCAPCFRSAGCEHMDCIRKVTADEVYRSVKARLVADGVRVQPALLSA